MKLALMCVGLLAVMTAGPAVGDERLVMRVSPAVAFAPASLIVRAMVASSPHNRSIEIIADSTDFYRSSEVPLDGDHAPKTTVFEFRNMPSGRYRVRAVLKNGGGEALALADTPVNVIAKAPFVR
jgi:hypothetical protein